MHEPTYDEVLLSGYTAGYESGYTDGQEECRDYSREYFTIEALEDGDLTVRKACDYSINGGEWISITGETAITLNDGDKVRFRGESDVLKREMFFRNTLAFKVYGNIESLEYGDDFIGRVVINNSRMFQSLFEVCTGLTSVENIVLPATTLTERCYAQMFRGCRGLVDAPELPALVMARICYANMFEFCTSLTTAPELPATVLEFACYDQMFRGSGLTTPPRLPATTLAQRCYEFMLSECPSLTVAPELPVETLVEECYDYMFSDSTSLNYIKCLATDISAKNCMRGWVANISPTGTFVKAAGVEWPTGNSGIPVGWTVIEE